MSSLNTVQNLSYIMIDLDIAFIKMVVI